MLLYSKSNNLDCSVRSGLARGIAFVSCSFEFSFELIEPVARRTGVADAAFARRANGGGRTEEGERHARRTSHSARPPLYGPPLALSLTPAPARPWSSSVASVASVNIAT